jgi:hypothetical protein
MRSKSDDACTLKKWFVWLFWFGPAITSFLLSPGGNGRNIPFFSSWQLWLLGLCGCLQIIGAMVSYFPFRIFQFAYRTGAQRVGGGVAPSVLFLIFGWLDVYFALKGFGLVH